MPRRPSQAIVRGLWLAAWSLLLSSSSSGAQELKRLNNLDYLDVPALQYYLSPSTTEDYDVAILFYAQWSDNCHALAPIWDQISGILNAGTTESNVIVGLFDCEADFEHSEICTTVGVAGYPTLAFISLAGHHHHLARQKPKHVTKYAANWQYGDALLDWIRTLSRLSQWHRAGWGKRVRNALLGRKDPNAGPQPLPLGVPQAIRSEVELHELQQESNATKTLALRSSNFVECLLFPVSVAGAPSVANDGGKNYTDVFAYLHEFGAWKTQDRIPDLILRTCASEVSLDYCQRVSTSYMERWIDGLSPTATITEEDFAAFQMQLAQHLNETEPFCARMDECAVAEFALEPMPARPVSLCGQGGLPVSDGLSHGTAPARVRRGVGCVGCAASGGHDDDEKCRRSIVLGWRLFVGIVDVYASS